MDESHLPKYQSLSPEAARAFSARLKDREWMIVSCNNVHRQIMGQVYKEALRFKIASHIAPAFIVGDPNPCKAMDGFYLEGINRDVIAKWMVVTGTTPFITSEGYPNDNNQMDELDYDHLHVGDLLDKRFYTGYFIVGIAPNDMAYLDITNDAGEPLRGLTVKNLAAFSVPTLKARLEAAETDPSATCAWCHKTPLED